MMWPAEASGSSSEARGSLILFSKRGRRWRPCALGPGCISWAAPRRGRPGSAPIVANGWGTRPGGPRATTRARPWGASDRLPERSDRRQGDSRGPRVAANTVSRGLKRLKRRFQRPKRPPRHAKDFREGPEKQKSVHSLRETYMSSIFCFGVRTPPKTAQEAPKKRLDGPRGPQDCPKGAGPNGPPESLPRLDAARKTGSFGFPHRGGVQTRARDPPDSSCVCVCVSVCLSVCVCLCQR